MEAVILLVFVSGALVLGAVGLFAWTVRERSLDHADRLALLPLREDHGSSAEDGTPREKPAATRGS